MSTPLEFPYPATPEQQFTATNDIVYVYDGAKWTSLGATIVSDENNAIIGASAPLTAANGSFWYDTVAGHLKVLVNGTWKDVRPSS